MSIKAILFDLDDTLVVEEDSAQEALLATCALAHRKHGLDPEALCQSVRHHAGELWRTSPHIDYCRAIGVSSWEGLWAQFLGHDPNLRALHAWAPTYQKDAWTLALADFGLADPGFGGQLAATFPAKRRLLHKVFPDVMRVVSDLQKDYRLSLVTNGVPDIQHRKIQAAGLAPRFDSVVISGDIGIGKPDGRIFRRALDDLAVNPDQAVMVGNSLERDIRGAHQAGLETVWLNRSRRLREGDITPDAEIASLDELRGVLNRLNHRSDDQRSK